MTKKIATQREFTETFKMQASIAIQYESWAGKLALKSTHEPKRQLLQQRCLRDPEGHTTFHA